MAARKSVSRTQRLQKRRVNFLRGTHVGNKKEETINSTCSVQPLFDQPDHLKNEYLQKAV